VLGVAPLGAHAEHRVGADASHEALADGEGQVGVRHGVGRGALLAGAVTAEVTVDVAPERCAGRRGALPGHQRQAAGVEDDGRRIVGLRGAGVHHAEAARGLPVEQEAVGARACDECDSDENHEDRMRPHECMIARGT
jgi:hypothetical protein